MGSMPHGPLLGRILGLDPSSTCTGYACLIGPEHVIDAGYLRGRKQDSAEQRSLEMADQLQTLLEELEPDHIVIEGVSSHVHGRNRSGGAGLAKYGTAVGVMLRTCQIWARVRDRRLYLADPNVWTGRKSKSQRHRQLGLAFPKLALALESDSGGDLGDAIGLALWLQASLKLERAGQVQVHACV